MIQHLENIRTHKHSAFSRNRTLCSFTALGCRKATNTMCGADIMKPWDTPTFQNMSVWQSSLCIMCFQSIYIKSQLTLHDVAAAVPHVVIVKNIALPFLSYLLVVVYEFVRSYWRQTLKMNHTGSLLMHVNFLQSCIWRHFVFLCMQVTSKQ